MKASVNINISQILKALAFILSCEFIGALMGLIALTVMYPSIYVNGELVAHASAGLLMVLVGFVMIAIDASRSYRRCERR